MKKSVISERAPKPIGPYSQGIRTQELVFCSGQVGLDPRTGDLSQGVVAQTAKSLENLKSVLSSVGADLNDVVKTTVFMTDLSEYSLMNDEYSKHFSAPFPARSTVQVAALPRGAKVEIEAIAVKSS